MVIEEESTSNKGNEPPSSSPAPLPTSVGSTVSTPSARLPEGAESAILKQCLKLLKGNSDEHKFAGLVMVTKHMPTLTGASAEVGQLRKICDAIGTPFLHRLLKTEGDRPQPSSSGGSGVSVYQQIAVGVLATFLQDETLVAPAVARILRAATPATESEVLVDALACAHALASVPEGMERLLRAGTAEAIVGHLTKESRNRVFVHRNASWIRNNDGSKTTEDMDAGHTNAQEPTGTGAGGGSKKKNGESRADKISVDDGQVQTASMATRWEELAFRYIPRIVEVSGGNCLSPRELIAIAEAFRDDPTPTKFAFMDLLLRWVTLQESEQPAGGARVAHVGPSERIGGEEKAYQMPSLGAWTRRGAFPAALREGLVQALHGAAGDECRDSALALFAMLLRVFGQAWAVEDDTVAETGKGVSSGGGENGDMSPPHSAEMMENSWKFTRKRGTFVAFAVRCAAGEVRILLDESLSILLPGPSGRKQKGKGAVKLKGKARGPMKSRSSDPFIKLAAELAEKATTTRGEAGQSGVGQEAAQLPTRVPLMANEHRAIKERRVARIVRMLPVSLGIIESTIAFLCGGEADANEGEEEGEEVEGKAGGVGERKRKSRRWEELPIEILQDLQKSLIALFGCVLDFLAELRPRIVPSPWHLVPSPSPVDLWTLRRLGLNCSRTLGMWVAEDPDSMPQRFLENLRVLLALNARPEPPDSDDEDSDSDSDFGARGYESTEISGPAALKSFPQLSSLMGSLSLAPLESSDGIYGDGYDVSDGYMADQALINVLRAMLALSYEPAPLVAMVEEGVTARLVRLAAAGPGAIAMLLSGTADDSAAPTKPSLPLPEQTAEALRSPLITMCSLLTNILTSAGHLAWPESIGREKTAVAAAVAAAGRRRKSSVSGPRSPATHPVLAHPAMGDCLVSLAEIAGLAGAARRARGGTRWRLLAAHATLVVMVVARAATPGNGLAPEPSLAKRSMRWRGVDTGGHGDDSTVWRAMAVAVDEALGSLNAVPGRRLVGANEEDEEASYEEGSIWQWCLECARVIEALPGGAPVNAYVSAGLVPISMLRSLAEAAADGRI